MSRFGPLEPATTLVNVAGLNTGLMLRKASAEPEGP